FFVSFFCLALICISNIFFLAVLAVEIESAWANFVQFAMGGLIGSWIAHMFIKGHSSVLIHEVKHSIVSNLVGNRAKGMRIQRKSGHFKYSYTKATEKYNALIALAPYFLPVFTFATTLAAHIIYAQTYYKLLFVVGAGFGMDMILNWRDVSPIQTDLTNITGGYKVGVAFVTLMNLAIFTFLLAWVLDGGQGLKFLFAALWESMVHVVAYYRGL
ncbi:MAG: hypothetical protein KDD62_13815, partial [Bdellovibrionales bacterium]|nr:hypothetical protein [Bdellovibrionales bacterium]